MLGGKGFWSMSTLGGEGGVELLNLGMTLSQLAVVEVIQLDRPAGGQKCVQGDNCPSGL